MYQCDLCYGLPGSTGAILFTLNKQDEADKLCSAINKADVFQGDGLRASVREVEREKPAEAEPARRPKPRVRARKKEDES